MINNWGIQFQKKPDKNIILKWSFDKFDNFWVKKKKPTVFFLCVNWWEKGCTCACSGYKHVLLVTTVLSNNGNFQFPV